eukprot:6236247-Prorocentrum_lima.AAC.1
MTHACVGHCARQEGHRAMEGLVRDREEVPLEGQVSRGQQLSWKHPSKLALQSSPSLLDVR